MPGSAGTTWPPVPKRLSRDPLGTQPHDHELAAGAAPGQHAVAGDDLDRAADRVRGFGLQGHRALAAEAAVRVSGARLRRDGQGEQQDQGKEETRHGIPPQPATGANGAGIAPGACHAARRRMLPAASYAVRSAPAISAAISATSVGVRPTRTPLASSASALALAVPAVPDTIAPAWPIVLPGGAVKPAM